MHYFDHNATTVPAPEVIDAVADCLRQTWGNPSSTHAAGQAARRLLAESRSAVAQLLGAQPVELVFTSGATESNLSVLAGVVARSSEPPTVVLSAIEHAAFMGAAQRLADAGRLRLRLLPVGASGQVDLEAAQRLIRPGVALMSVMAANNETGVLQPLAEVGALARAAGAVFHVDATQWVGKLPFDFAALRADLASVSAHKLKGPKGVGALLLRRGLDWPALLPGRQERGRRGGTENLPGIAGFAAAARLVQARLPVDAAHMAGLRAQLETTLARQLPVRIFGADAPRLPNTSNLCIATLPADLVLNRLQRHGLQAASGAACSAGADRPSPVLLAMGVDEASARGAIRISLGRDTRAAQVQQLTDVLCSELRGVLTQAA